MAIDTENKRRSALLIFNPGPVPAGSVVIQTVGPMLAWLYNGIPFIPPPVGRRFKTIGKMTIPIRT